VSTIFISHRREVLSAVEQAINRGLEICGGKAESYAKRLCPVDTGRLRNSITHALMDELSEVIGTNVVYAPYVELGHHSPSGSFVAPKEFLKPAVEGHASEYRTIIQNELSKI
jgi:phage gpG-like protein